MAFPLVTMVMVLLCSCRTAIRVGGFSTTGHTAYILSAAVRSTGENLPEGSGWSEEVCGGH